MDNKSRKKIIILSFIIILVILSSHLFVIIEADHDCVGEDCCICQTIQAVESNLNEYLPKLSEFIAILSTVFGIVILLDFSRFVLTGLSLVLLKVKLTD